MEEEVAAWEGVWMKGKRVRAASLSEGVRVRVALCWLLLMLQVVLLFAGEKAWWWECLFAQQQEDLSVDASLAQVGVAVEVSLEWRNVGVVLACL